MGTAETAGRWLVVEAEAGIAAAVCVGGRRSQAGKTPNTYRWWDRLEGTGIVCKVRYNAGTILWWFVVKGTTKSCLFNV